MIVAVSQKVRIVKVGHTGASVCLGYDSCRNLRWTRNPERIMDWLCDGWRCRFNQHREHRTTRRLMEDVETHERMWVDVPLGGADVSNPVKDSEARVACPWMACVPAAILASCLRVENTEWYAGLKRRKTNGGKTPGFKSRKRNPQYFVCWRNQSKTGNALYRQVSRKRGVVTIAGSVPKGMRKPGESTARWKLTVHIRVSQPIRPYTSVAINWTSRALVFTNEPQPIQRQGAGRQVGIDRGCAHTLALSDGTMLDMPQPSERENREYLRLQRKLARQDRTNEKRGGKTAKFRSNRRKLTLQRMQAIRQRVNNRKTDWVNKTTTRLVEDYDLIALEALKTQRMSRRPKAKPDPEHPGHYLRNNATVKAGLNRSILDNRWADIQTKLDYKTRLAGTQLILVNPAYTSQTCNQCGHVAKENRENQADFHCVACNHRDNADTNAAKNILDRAIRETGMDDAEGAEEHNTERDATSRKDAPMKRQPLQHVWEDRPQRGGVPHTTGIPRL